MTQLEFKKIFDLYFASVRSYIFYRTGNQDLANDVAQETFLKIWEKHNSINNKKVKGLLFKIACDIYVSQYRKEKRSFEFLNHFMLTETVESPEEKLAFEEMKEIYSKALHSMGENQRTVFMLSRYDNLKYREISEILGISIKAVEKRMKIALEHLRKYLPHE